MSDVGTGTAVTPAGAAMWVAVIALLVASCAGGDDESATPATAGIDAPTTTEAVVDGSSQAEQVTSVPASSPDASITTEAVHDGVRRVPAEYATIQGAVDAAVPGDLVLIDPGSYHESVDVKTDQVTIRGLDRDNVVLDGRLELDNGIRVLGASGVAVENLTATNYTNNGLFWVSATGYRASYVTTYRTGDYGIYAFDSVGGLIEHSHTVGSKDAGVYIGQCYPCDAVIDHVESEYNGLGYSGTNSGGNLLIVNSSFHNNRAGILPNSGSYELCYPERETTIVGNLVYSNNQTDTPAIDFALLAQGNGILVAGGIGNVIERNRVWDHNRTGIGLVPFPEDQPNDDLPTPQEWATPCAEQKLETPVIPEGGLLWDSQRNRVVDNVVSDSREADLAVASAGSDISTFGNCFAGNEFATTAPLDLERLAPCEGTGSGDWTAGDLQVVRWLAEQATLPGDVDWTLAELPKIGNHDQLPDPATAPARPATDVPPTVDLAAIEVPAAP